MNTVKITMTVNKKKVAVETLPHRTLLDVIRDDLGLTGTKEGCGKGECGACTVIMNDRPVNACLVLAINADKADILTIEGLAANPAGPGAKGKLHPLQDSFIRNGAVQCGFCIPGMIMSGHALLEKNPHPNRDEIKEAIAGNLCRCTGYHKIIDAIEEVAQ